MADINVTAAGMTATVAGAVAAGWLKGGIAKFLPGLWYRSRVQGATCPKSCGLLAPSAGAVRCYADPTKGFRPAAMSAGAERRRELPAGVESLPRDAWFRLHPAGDFGVYGDGDTLDVGYLADLAAGLVARPDVRGWTYTHGWKEWGRALAPLRGLMSVMASCDTAADADVAYALGWAPAYHGPDVSRDSHDYITPGGLRLAVCPELRGRAKCGPGPGGCTLCEKPQAFDGVGFPDHD
jgi:hypothetical protein